MSLLNSAGFEGATEEFISAHKSYRKKDYKTAINQALKAFESTLKSICDAKGWAYPEKATAKALVNLVFNKELIPKELLSHYSALQSTLESGVPTLRNVKSGHGQGAKPTKVPPYLAAYALHLTASNIVMLTEAYSSSA